MALALQHAGAISYAKVCFPHSHQFQRFICLYADPIQAGFWLLLAVPISLFPSAAACLKVGTKISRNISGCCCRCCLNSSVGRGQPTASRCCCCCWSDGRFGLISPFIPFGLVFFFAISSSQVWAKSFCAPAATSFQTLYDTIRWRWNSDPKITISWIMNYNISVLMKKICKLINVVIVNSKVNVWCEEFRTTF